MVREILGSGLLVGAVGWYLIGRGHMHRCAGCGGRGFCVAPRCDRAFCDNCEDDALMAVVASLGGDVGVSRNDVRAASASNLEFHEDDDGVVIRLVDAG